MGDLIEIPPDLNRKEIEEWRQKIERAMRELSDDTDERFEELYAASSKLRGMRRK